jgi:uncharacterized membrane protein
MSVLYILAGIGHFVASDFYLKMMPEYLPFHLPLIWISGAAESTLGILILFQKTRKTAICLIIVMLILFFVIHVQMVIDQYPKMGLLFWIAVFRLPMQFLLIYWAKTLKNIELRSKS